MRTAGTMVLAAAFGISTGVMAQQKAAAPAATPAPAAAPAGKDTIWPAAAIKWEPAPIKGIKIAKLWGDWTKGGSYGQLTRFDAGLVNPLHHHTQALRIVVIKGTFVHTPAGGKQEKLGPGSYLVQAAGEKHVSGCARGAECEFFQTSDDKFDMVPAEAPKADAKKPAEKKK